MGGLQISIIIQTKHILTANKIISVNGKVFHNDRRRRIDLKKPIRDLFEGERFLEVFYTMELCLSETKAVERLKELTAKNVMPIILYFETK